MATLETKSIPLSAITRNPDQPRQHFDAKALEELASSIERNQLLQPITVRPIEPDDAGHRYQIVMGERRWRAHLLLAERGAATTILAHVRRMDERDMHVNAILENLQREEVSPLEEAVAYQRALDELGFTVEELAERLGISQPWRITYRTKLLRLTEDNRRLVEKGVVSMTQAYHMAGLSPNGQQKFLAIAKQGLASTDQAAAQAAAAIEAQEAQIDMPMLAALPKRTPIRNIEDRIEAVGARLMPLFKDGAFRVAGSVDPSQAKRSVEKIKLIQKHLGQIERELVRAASVSAVV